MAFVDTDLVRAHRRPEDEPRRHRAPRARRARSRARRGARRRAHAARQARPVGGRRELSAAARLIVPAERHRTEATMTIATHAAVAAADAIPPKTSPWPVFWVASVAAFLVSLDATMLYAAFGALRAGFPEASAADLSWVLNALHGGLCGDADPRRRPGRHAMAASACSCSASTLFIAASAACGLAGSVAWLIAARVLQAVGAALLTPASLSIVLAAFPQHKRALTVSLWGAVARLRGRGGPEPGLVRDRDRRLAVGVLHQPADRRLLAVARRHGCCRSRRARRARRRVDGVGMALLIVAVGAIALAIVEAESPRWTRTELAAVAATGVDRARRLRRLGDARARSAGRPRACSAIRPTARRTPPRCRSASRSR